MLHLKIDMYVFSPSIVRKLLRHVGHAAVLPNKNEEIFISVRVITETPGL